MKITAQEVKRLRVCPTRYRAIMKALGNPGALDPVDLADIAEVADQEDVAWLLSALDDYGRAEEYKDVLAELCGSEKAMKGETTSKLALRLAQRSTDKAAGNQQMRAVFKRHVTKS